MRTKPIIPTLAIRMLRRSFTFGGLAALFYAWTRDFVPPDPISAWQREFSTEIGIGLLLLVAVSIVPHEKLYKYSYIIPIFLVIFAFALMGFAGIVNSEFWQSFLMTTGSGIFLYVGFDFFLTR